MHPVHVSKVSLIDPETGKATRVRKGFLESGDTVRISKKSGLIIEKNKKPAYQVKVRNKNKVDGVKDTPPQKMLEVTYKGENFD